MRIGVLHGRSATPASIIRSARPRGVEEVG